MTETLTDFVAEWSRATAEYQQPNEQHADASAAQWPNLASAWLEKVWGGKD